METFNYLIVDKDGARRRGKIEALDAQKAAAILREKGYVVVRLKPAIKRPGLFGGGWFQKISEVEKTNFTRLLATMINTGLPITVALQNLQDQSDNPKMKGVIADILRDVQGGSSLSQALEKHPQVFSPIFVSLVRTGEESGNLDQTLLRLAQTLEREREFRGKLKSAMIYPVIVIVAMGGVVALMMIVVIPRISEVYQEANAPLPLPTRVLIFVSNIIARGWLPLLILIGGAFYLVRTLRKTVQGEKFFSELTFRTPVFGRLNQEIILTRLTRTLGVLVGSGVSILDALRLTAQAVGDNAYQDELVVAADGVERGSSLSTGLQSSERFPPILSQMIAVGEDTGTLDEVLSKLASFFETESEYAIRNLTAVMEPLIIIVLGVGVTLLAAAIILPLFNLVNVIR